MEEIVKNDAAMQNSIGVIFGDSPLDKATITITRPELSKNGKIELDSYIEYLIGANNLDRDAIKNILPRLEQAYISENKLGVNKVIFGDLDKLAKKTVAQNINKDDIEKIVQLEQDTINAQTKAEILNAEKTLDNYIRYFNDYSATATMYAKDIAQQRLKIDSLKGKKVDSGKIEQEMQALFEKGLSLGTINFDLGKISFITPEIVLSRFDSTAGIHQAVNMGSFSIEVCLKNCGYSVKPFLNNLNVERYYHPHVDTTGYVCLGNASTAMSKAIAERSVLNIVMTIYSVLKEYNDDSPFAALSKFYLMANPELVKTLDKVWVKSNEAVWAPLDSFPCTVSTKDIVEEEERYDGEAETDVTWICFYPWELQYQGTGIAVKDEWGSKKYAVRSNNNQKVAIEDTSQWEF